MKAIVYERYGPPDVLELRDVDAPVPKDNEVLVKVHASSINDWDWGLVRGIPFLARVSGGGLLKPKYKILGADVAGQVEAIGKDVTKFRVGDEVMGDLSASGWGAYAEHVCAREDALVAKPASLSFDEAAAVPQAGVLALKGVQEKGHVRSGQKVLINGAGGGAGTFAVQIAKSLGAEVTGVDSTTKLDIMRTVGADHVVDFTQEDFTKNGERYDVILDMASHRSIFDYKRSLSPNGVYVMEGGSTARIFEAMLFAPLISLTGSKKMGILGHQQNRGLTHLNELFEAGKLKPVIDTRYPLSDIAEAFLHFGSGQAKGKIVITV